ASATDAPGASSPWSSPPAQDPAASQESAGGGWAPPPIDPIPSQQQSWGQPPPAPEVPQQQSWGQPQSAPEAPQQPSWDQRDPAPQQSWGRPSADTAAPTWEDPVAEAPPVAPPQSWGQPQSAPEAPQSDAGQGWAPPPAPAEPVQASPAPYGQASPGPYSQGTENAPSDLTGDAWDATDQGVDEQTRLTAVDDPLGDLEQTRISAVQLPAVKKLRLSTDDGGERIVEKAVVIGRNPVAPGEEVLFVMKDDTRSVSKTHLRIDGTGDEVTVTDLGSTNGSSILREDGSRENLVPNSPTVLPSGAQVTLGDRAVCVERMQ
ncbi:MAG: FHA domain-containing protein, partial [Brachybacterium sp.]|nr:FHA domain-containing protein [Brachybacterium sp.]